MQASSMALIESLELMSPDKTELVDRAVLKVNGSLYHVSSAVAEAGMLIIEIQSDASPSYLFAPVTSIEDVQFSFNVEKCAAVKVQPAFLTVRSHLRGLLRDKERRNGRA